ncbi:MAG TPA: aminotransferase class III-fold pyridoxal phosphate-dependent enzyme [Terriglobales bacterium]|nr:aminotransferase class III-fold pyridoxal phosphate-dependent enzyme [Terriglobales bacterium]
MPPSQPVAVSWSSAFPRSFRRPYPQAVRGEGVWLYDAAGKRYLDFSGSAAVNFVGHGVREIADALAEQARTLEFAHTSQFATPVAEEFAQELLAFAGEGFKGGCVYFTSSGSEAIETALKLARQYQVEIGQKQRNKFASRNQSYHGATLGAVGVSGNARRRELYLPLVADSAKVSIPYCYRCHYDCGSRLEAGRESCGARYAGELADLLSTHGRETAAFLFEPVSGATLGAAVPPADYLPEVARTCARHGVLTIADEVMTGMGRTGRNFAVDHWPGVHSEAQPDILVTAKGVASGYAPLGAVIASRKVVTAIAAGSGAFVHGLTYNAHPIATAAGHAVLRKIVKEKLVARADSGGQAGSAMATELKRLRSLDSVGDVRGLGLLWGVEFVADKDTKRPFDAALGFSQRVAEAAIRRGLLVYPMQGCVDGYAGDHLLLAPPAVITPEEITTAVTQLAESITEAASGATRAK